MFASQLLRILQTMPNDVKYETWAFDPDERSSSVKGSRNSRFYDSESFGSKAESVSFGNREMYQKREFVENCGNEHWSAKSMNGFSKDHEGGTKDFPRKEDRHGLLYHLSGENGDSDSLSSETKEEDKSWRSREFECSLMVEKSEHRNEDDVQDSGHILISASSFLDPYPDSDPDKIKLDFDLPELEVCYKETNYHIVKDACADEIMPEEDNILIENGNCGHCEDLEVRVGEEPVISDGSTDCFLENTKRVTADESGSKEETKDVLLEEGKPKSHADSSLEKDTDKDHDADDSIQTDKNVNGALGEETFIVSSLPIQEFGTRSFLRSFLNSLDIEENTIVQTRNDKQVSFGESVSESFAVSSAEQKEEIQSRSMLYRSRVERRSITFNFNSPLPLIPGDMIESQDLHEHENPWGTSKYSTGNIPDRSLDAYYSKSSSTSPVHYIINEDTSYEKCQETSTDKQDTRSFDLSTDDHVQIFSSKIPSPPNNNGQEIELHFSKHERGNSDNVSVVSQIQYDEADSSHSAASFIMFSGPIAYSGSLSLRSDGSATSTRSFAFPVLQSEGNRSPVRMENTDLRHYQKHKYWRSGLLCCRF
ncbi:uncharacterized protein LOC142522667 isoform X2 [Primulina tabacum]|uniref:uncharacterized protein LOC142522667 isoform X2 n=1 Tax=Primulina tabacum TaxID=48773 RepID=UPI003F5A0A92